MEHFFHRYAHWLRHHVHKLKRSVSHHEMFHSKNARLAIILIIAAAIPLTVLAVQQVQDIRQQAAGTKASADCTQASGYIVEPLHAVPPQAIIAKKADGGMLDNEVIGFGNGVEGQCVQEGNNIKCPKTKGKKGKTSDPDDLHTMFSIQSGSKVDLCNWYTKKIAGPTPRPSGSRQPITNNCDAKISAVCNAENPPKPGINLDWKLQGGSECSIEVKDKQGKSVFKNTECEKKNQNIFTDIGNTKDYTLTVSNGTSGCTNKVIKTVTTSCGAPTPKPGQGTPTSTPKPNEQPVVTPKAGQPPAPKIKDFKCQLGTVAVLYAEWDEVDFPNRNGYVYEIYDVTDNNNKVGGTSITETHTPSGGGINPTENHEYRIKVAAKTGSTTGVFAEKTTKCTSSGTNINLIPPTNLISNCDGTETGKNVEFRWKEVVGADSYVIHVTEYKGSTKTFGPKTYTPTATDKTEGDIYIGNKNPGNDLRTTKGYTYKWEIATKIGDKTSEFVKGPDTTCTTQGLDPEKRSDTRQAQTPLQGVGATVDNWFLNLINQ